MWKLRHTTHGPTKEAVINKTAPIRYAILVLAVSITTAIYPQSQNIALPTVSFAAVPLYPPLARAAHVEGVIHVEVTTDGAKVVAARSKDSYKILADAAEENAKTWKFATHDPTTFTVTYRYRLVVEPKGNPTVILRLPTEVEVLTMPRLIDDPALGPGPTQSSAPQKP